MVFATAGETGQIYLRVEMMESDVRIVTYMSRYMRVEVYSILQVKI